MPQYAIAMRVEAENGKQTIYHDIFAGANKFEAIGKALETFIRGGAVHECNVKQLAGSPTGGWTTTLSSLDEEILNLCRSGRKINAIKLHREHTGMGLKESKDYVEALMSQHHVI